jgi:hypothetical protein
MKTEQLEQIAKEYAKRMNGVNVNELFPNTDETIGEIGAKDFIEGYNYAKAESGWINAIDEQPELINNENYSPNVLAVCNGKLMIMCYCYNPSEDDNERGYFWANCYGNIDGEAEFDDDYEVTFWQYLPELPSVG